MTFLFFASDSYKKRADVLEASIRKFHSEAKIIRERIEFSGTGYPPGLAKRRLERVLELLAAGHQQIILLGADCVFYRKIPKYLLKEWSASAVVLTPHITEYKKTQEENGQIYMTGHCNADFVVFHPGAEYALSETINQPMIEAPYRGHFYEQTYMSGWPFMFDYISVCNKLDINWAYFNAEQRPLDKINPILVQFSGFDPELYKQTGRMSKHSISVVSTEAEKKLFDEYYELIK